MTRDVSQPAPPIIEEYFDGGAVVGEDEDIHLEVGSGAVVFTIQQGVEIALALASVLRRLRAAKKDQGQ